jgi:TonB family protein
MVSPSALDAALKLVHPVSPARPNSFSGGKPPIGPLDLSQPSIPAAMTPRPPDKKTGEALVEFFVDEDGCVQLPRVVSATEPEFGAAAAQAISEWRFAPPTQGGKPVIERAQVPVKFGRG